jgi:hypothetical protein
MTTIRQELVTCAVCGELTQVMVMDSTSTFGPPDLDLRPAEIARSSIFAWIQQCSSCGYCAPTLDEATPSAREVVNSDAYRAQLADEDLPALARSFLCSSMVFEEQGDEAAAAQNAIEAAWVCDDKDLSGAATQCRLRAVELLRGSEAEGDAYSDPSTKYAVIVDLLRHAGRFEDAVAQADAALADAEGEVAVVLAFSRSLALAGDPGSYTVGDAMAAERTSD